MAFRPRRWRPPAAPRLVGGFAPNDRLAGAELWPTGGAGPEDVVLDAEGRLYAGLDDGRIIRFTPSVAGSSPSDPQTIASTGGRPLGLELTVDGNLIICDAHKGLLRLPPGGSLETLADSFEGERFVFTNNASVGRDGTIYFTDSSRRYAVDKYKLDLLEHSGTGRLFKRSVDGRLELLLDGLHFANGVALGPDEDFLLVVETASYSIQRLWLRGERQGRSEPFADNLPGFPDNLSFENGIFWVAIPSPRDGLLDAMLPRPWMRHVVARLPEPLQPKPKRHGFVLGYDTAGRVVHNLQDPSGRVAIVTGVREHGNRLYLGSLSESAVAVVDL